MIFSLNSSPWKQSSNKATCCENVNSSKTCNKPQQVDFFSSSTLSGLSIRPSACQPVRTSCHARQSVSWVTNIPHGLGQAGSTWPLATPEHRGAIGTGGGRRCGSVTHLTLNFCKRSLQTSYLQLFVPVLKKKKKKSKIFLRRGIVVPVWD